MAKTYDHLFKVLLVGDYGVGKTEILVRLSEDTFNNKFISTIGIDFKIWLVEVDGKKIKLQLWDTPGQERFHTITTSYYRKATGIMLVYDVAKENTFKNIGTYLEDIRKNADEAVELMLIGHMYDVDAEREVTKERAEEFAQEQNMTFFEVCAKAALNVEESMITLTRNMLKKVLARQSTEERKLNPMTLTEEGHNTKSTCLI